ncbi:aspartoacylase [Lyngbya aestuarii]|uniref:aspartoacylase n=1 Tax=Lyngbya aestuarii TaxID=118322 RepID=UPI00403E0D71
MDQISRVAIVGGVHGNEFTGAYLIKKFERFPELIKRSSLASFTLLGNPRAFEARKRYIDKDLNRCFSSEYLQNPTLSNYEENRAQVIHQMLGQQGQYPADFIVDLHSTTTNMGLTIILGNYHPFNLQLAAYLSSISPLVKVYSCIKFGQQDAVLRSLCELSLAIEVGPVAQGVLDAVCFQKAEQLVYAILDYLENYNQGKTVHRSQSLTVYKFLKVIDYPRNDQGEIQAMIHPQLQGKDYEALNPGDPIFLTFDNRVISYQGDSTVYPVFINEAAYYEKEIALHLTEKQDIFI